MAETKNEDVVNLRGSGLSCGVTAAVLDALMRNMTAEDAAHAFEPLIVDGVRSKRERGACTECVVVLVDPFARGKDQVALQVCGLTRDVVLRPDSPTPPEFKDLVSKATGGGSVPFMLAKKGEDPEAQIAGFVAGWIHMDTGKIEVVTGAGAAPCDLANTPLEEIMSAFAAALATHLKTEPKACVAWVVVDRKAKKARTGWLSKEDVATKDLGIPEKQRQEILAGAPPGFGWTIASDEGPAEGEGSASAVTALVQLNPVCWGDDLAKIMITMVPALAIRLRDGHEVAVLMVDRKNERILVEGMTAEKALEWIQPTATDDMPEGERKEVEDLIAEFKSQLARRAELPELGVCLALQDRGPGPFGIVGWASKNLVPNAADREAMMKRVHSDGRKWKNATDLTATRVR